MKKRRKERQSDCTRGKERLVSFLERLLRDEFVVDSTGDNESQTGLVAMKHEKGDSPFLPQ